LYGPEHTELYRLTRSYRSTREIVEFTRGMIPGGDAIEPFDRNGDKPNVTMALDREDLHNKIDAAIAKLWSEGFESIGVICKTAEESAEAFASLNERQPVRLISKHTLAYEKGKLVIPAYLAKGVEFDAVIIYNGSQEQYGRESDLKLFYTACTRAMHLLCIFSIGEPSFFITSQPSKTYTTN
jgi:DNA helicase-2/ATP-dependent DNA helicase PcrA